MGHSVEGTPIADSETRAGSLPPSSFPGARDEAGNETSLEHDQDHDHDHEEGAGGKGKEKGEGRDSHPPAKRYRLTNEMKELIWQLVCLSNECCRIENEKKYVPPFFLISFEKLPPLV